MSGKKRRGRPPTYSDDDRRQLAEMIRLHGVRRLRDIYSLPISMGTLLKIAHDFGIELKKGRRPRPAA